ncbi:MAG TPA: DEAD/DEAH box helicase, partial [Planctomycetota bacterium]|nr:DEAD/DEAH box helicase [Planctomycetota bacterium]
MTREIAEADLESAERHLRERHHLDERAARILARHVHEEIEIAGSAPTDRTIVVQSFPDEAGDWRVCVLSPFGAAIHAPWAIAVQALLEKESALTIDAVTSDDGIVFRIPDRGSAPSLRTLAIDPGDAEDLITERLASTSLFAARFRENAARALLLPRHRPGRRNPLWLQRKRAADLLAVAASFRSFPIILETFRDCLRDVFDLVGLESVLRDIAEERIRIVEIERSSPSPFAASLLFSYVGNFIYEGDAPLPERRAQALAIDHAQLRELLGESELRELFDEELIAQLEAELQHLDPKRKARHLDATHDLLLLLGDLTKDEIAARSASDGSPSEWIDTLAEEARAVPIVIAGEERWIAIEDAASYRDALGIKLPTSLPESLLAPMADAALGLVSRFARTHGPFAAERIARRFGLPIEDVEARLESLESRGKVVRGAFLPNGSGEEWCDASVLQTLKRRALARLRAEIEPVEPAAFARFALAWQGIGAESARRESDPLLAAVTRLQGYPLLASALETEILPARVPDFDPVRLDLLCASGEIVWRGLEGVGAADGRIALYRRDEYDLLAPPAGRVEGDLAETIRDLLKRQGASFFPAIARATGAFVDDLLRTLWDLVWSGEVTNDTFAPLRAVLRASDPDVKKRRGRAALRSAARR